MKIKDVFTDKFCNGLSATINGAYYPMIVRANTGNIVISDDHTCPHTLEFDGDQGVNITYNSGHYCLDLMSINCFPYDIRLHKRIDINPKIFDGNTSELEVAHGESIDTYTNNVVICQGKKFLLIPLDE